jgi:hypothetical protein
VVSSELQQTSFSADEAESQLQLLLEVTLGGEIFAVSEAANISATLAADTAAAVTCLEALAAVHNADPLLDAPKALFPRGGSADTASEQSLVAMTRLEVISVNATASTCPQRSAADRGKMIDCCSTCTACSYFWVAGSASAVLILFVVLACVDAPALFLACSSRRFLLVFLQLLCLLLRISLSYLLI